MSTVATQICIPQVGAGPTGLYLALALIKNDIQVRIIDKDKEYHEGSRGAGVMVCCLACSGIQAPV